MTLSKSIFVDLEIDPALIMDDPDTFASMVQEKGDELTSIFTGKISVKGAVDEAATKAKLDRESKLSAETSVRPMVDDFEAMAESADIYDLYHMIQEAKKLVESLEVTFHSRARNEMIMNAPNVMDKAVAFDQYKKLRVAFDAFREFSKLMHSTNYVGLKAKSGNYGGGTEPVGYPAYRVNGDVYQNYRAVARILNWNPDDFHNHMSLVEKINETGVNVEIIEIEL